MHFSATTSSTIELWNSPTAGGIVLDEREQVGNGWQDSHIERLGSDQIRVRVWNLSSVALGTTAPSKLI